MQEQRERQTISPLSVMLLKNPESQNLDLTRAQVNELTIEIEFLVSMQKTFKGTITANQIEDLIKICCDGFSVNTIDNIRNELKKRGIYNS